MFRHEFDVTVSQNNHLPFILYDHGAVELTVWSKICIMLTELVRDKNAMGTVLQSDPLT